MIYFDVDIVYWIKDGLKDHWWWIDYLGYYKVCFILRLCWFYVFYLRWTHIICSLVSFLS